ncbi:MAG: helix-turn-helix domain-containing protein [Gammaproteobacteria bacterium]|nr:helix-turn-helix domain-containing protein [Gammaproteobacteria bacterium]
MGDFDQTVTFPQEVIEYQTRDGLSIAAAWRSYRGLTIAELAEKSGVSEQDIQQLEDSSVPAQADTIEKLAAGLDISVDQLKG